MKMNGAKPLPVVGIHDSYCRCRICKPPMVGQEANRSAVIFWGLFLLAIICMALFAGAR